MKISLIVITLLLTNSFGVAKPIEKESQKQEKSLLMRAKTKAVEKTKKIAVATSTKIAKEKLKKKISKEEKKKPGHST